MKRDTIYYQIFKRFPELLFELIDEPPPQAQQQRVLAFIDSLPKHQESVKVEPSPLGKKLRELRAQIVASGIPLLNDEELDREIAERRGGIVEASYPRPFVPAATYAASLTMPTSVTGLLAGET